MWFLEALFVAHHSPYRPTDTFWRSLTLRHAVLAIASAITVMSAIFEPLAGALFTVKLVEKSETVFVERVGILGMDRRRAHKTLC